MQTISQRENFSEMENWSFKSRIFVLFYTSKSLLDKITLIFEAIQGYKKCCMYHSVVEVWVYFKLCFSRMIKRIIFHPGKASTRVFLMVRAFLQSYKVTMRNKVEKVLAEVSFATKILTISAFFKKCIPKSCVRILYKVFIICNKYWFLSK